MPASMIMTGILELDTTLSTLRKTTANKVARAALRKGASIGAKAVKKEIPSLQKNARKAIGHSVKKNKTIDQTVAMFGTAGKRSASKKHQSKGVGITSANIHWLLIGTKERFHKSGKSTGEMPGSDAVSRGANKSKQELFSGMVTQARITLSREVSKVASR